MGIIGGGGDSKEARGRTRVLGVCCAWQGCVVHGCKVHRATCHHPNNSSAWEVPKAVEHIASWMCRAGCSMHSCQTQLITTIDRRCIEGQEHVKTVSWQNPKAVITRMGMRAMHSAQMPTASNAQQGCPTLHAWGSCILACMRHRRQRQVNSALHRQQRSLKFHGDRDKERMGIVCGTNEGSAAGDDDHTIAPGRSV